MHYFTMCDSRKYPYHPHGRDRIFQGVGGSICLIFQSGGRGGGVTIGKYFQRVLVTSKSQSVPWRERSLRFAVFEQIWYPQPTCIDLSYLKCLSVLDLHKAVEKRLTFTIIFCSWCKESQLYSFPSMH